MRSTVVRFKLSPPEHIPCSSDGNSSISSNSLLEEEIWENPCTKDPGLNFEKCEDSDEEEDEEGYNPEGYRGQLGNFDDDRNVRYEKGNEYERRCGYGEYGERNGYEDKKYGYKGYQERNNGYKEEYGYKGYQEHNNGYNEEYGYKKYGEGNGYEDCGYKRYEERNDYNKERGHRSSMKSNLSSEAKRNAPYVVPAKQPVFFDDFIRNLNQNISHNYDMEVKYSMKVKCFK